MLTSWRAALALLSVLLAFGGVAAGDNSGGGGQMPDPRVMSGIPRPDKQVPVGTIRVKVIAGELAKLAPVGTLVHLVALKADGALEKLTQPLGADGRALFTGLPTDGTVSYYAYTLLGDDRLESQVVVPDARAGIALMLVGRKLDADGKPVGEAIDDLLRGADAGTANAGAGTAGAGAAEQVPAGEVRIAFTADTPPETKVELVELGAPAARPLTAAVKKQADGAMRATFSGVASGPEHLYVARTTLGGKPALSRPFMLSPLAGARREIRAAGALVARLDIGAQIEGDHVAFQMQYTLTNLSGAPFDPGLAGIALPLPAGATELAIPDTLHDRVTVDARTVRWQGMVPAGETEVLVAFQLPIGDQGEVKFELPTPLGVTGGTLFIEKSSDTAALVPPKGATVEVKTPPGADREFFVAKPIDVAAGGTLSFVATGVAPGEDEAHGDPHGGGMPEPRQMSGQPRPEPKVKVGELTVKVVYGALAAVAPAGTPVHLVGVKEDGSAEKRTEPLGADGRAVFKGLALDRTVTYYAYCLLGDDRLESKLITPLPGVGTALMLSGRKRGADGQPVGKPIDEASDENLPVKVPPNEVWVAVDGEVPPGTNVELVEVGAPAGTAPRLAIAGKVPNGGGALVAQFRDLPLSADKVWVARVKVGDQTYVAKPFMVSRLAGVGRMVRAYADLLLRMHVAGELFDEAYSFQAQFVLGNLSGRPISPGQDGVLLPLPANAKNVAVAEEMQVIARVVPGKGVVWHGPIPAGATELNVSFQLAVEDGAIAFAMPLGLKLIQGMVTIEKAGNAELGPTADAKGMMKISGDTTAKVEVTTLDNGRRFWVLRNLQLDSGAVITFSLSKLPEPPLLGRATRTLAAITVLLLLGFALWMAVGGTGEAPRAEDEKQATAARRRQLLKRRESLYEELVKLERHEAVRFADSAGAPSSRYHSDRNTLVGRLASVLRELDEIEQGHPSGKPSSTGTRAA